MGSLLPICGPEPVPPSKYLPGICETERLLEDASSAQEFLSLIMCRWNTIAAYFEFGRGISTLAS